jgi:hypothetical protein
VASCVALPAARCFARRPHNDPAPPCHVGCARDHSSHCCVHMASCIVTRHGPLSSLHSRVVGEDGFRGVVRRAVRCPLPLLRASSHTATQRRCVTSAMRTITSHITVHTHNIHEGAVRRDPPWAVVVEAPSHRR